MASIVDQRAAGPDFRASHGFSELLCFAERGANHFTPATPHADPDPGAGAIRGRRRGMNTLGDEADATRDGASDRETTRGAPTSATARTVGLNDVPQDVLHECIFQLEAREQENAFLRGERNRLHKLATFPYLNGALALMKQQWREGYGAADLIDRAISGAQGDDSGLLYHLYRIMSYEDKVSIIPALVGRGFVVTQFAKEGEEKVTRHVPHNHCNNCPMTVGFGRSPNAERREANEAEAKKMGWIIHEPPELRFEVGATVECCMSPSGDVWKRGVVTQHWHHMLDDTAITPYQVRLDERNSDGDEWLIVTPEDGDHIIRAANGGNSS